VGRGIPPWRCASARLQEPRHQCEERRCCPLEVIEASIKTVETEILDPLKKVTA